MKKIDLASLIFDKIEELGNEAAAAYFSRSIPVIKKWHGGTVPADVGAAQKILDEMMEGGFELPVFDKPPEQGRTIPEPAPRVKEEQFETQPEKATQPEPVKPPSVFKKFTIATPINREMSFAVVQSHLGNWKATLPAEIRGLLSTMDFEPDTTPHVGRNRLTQRFLASGSEWMFWLDSDIIAPNGNAGWFKKRTGAKHADKWYERSAIERLTSRNKTFIGAVYRERSANGPILANPLDGEKNIFDEVKASGPVDKVIQVNWVGFGCVAVHRTVFDAILADQPEIKAEKEGDPHNFFTPIMNGPQNEDVAFAWRAKKAGHPAYVDMSVHCGHVGRTSFNP